MPVRAGAHADRVQRARELLTTKGRREQLRYVFEGPTLLEEAIASGVAIEEIFVLEHVYESNPSLARIEADGTSVALVDERTAAKLSDLQTPTGLVAIANIRYGTLAEILAAGLSLILADLNDPGNAGTLLRSAEAFGAGGVIFGRFGVDPHHPKVVRGSMGAIFRIPLAIATPDDVVPAAGAAGTTLVGLTAGGERLTGEAFTPPASLVVGHERQGLGSWDALCTRQFAIPMHGKAESLNAAVAGSIALYEAARSHQ